MSNSTFPPETKDVDKGPALEAVTLALLVISTLCIAIRCYVRLCMSKSFGWDDGFIIAAMLLLVIGDSFIFLAIRNGCGRHAAFLADPQRQLLTVLKWITYYEMDNVLGALLTKISISIFILRINIVRRLKWATWIIISFLALATLATIILLSLSCIPLRKLWEPEIEGVCSLVGVAYKVSYLQSAFAVISDVFLTASPIFILWNVQMNRRRKVAICVLMSLGLVATASNALRNYYIPVLSSADYTFSIVPILYVATLEFSLGIIAACMPTFMPLFTSNTLHSWLSRFFVKTSSRSSAAAAKARWSLPKISPVVKCQGILNGIRPSRRSSQSDGSDLLPLHHIKGSEGIISQAAHNIDYEGPGHHRLEEQQTASEPCSSTCLQLPTESLQAVI